MEPLAPETGSQHLGGQPKFAPFPGYAGLAEWMKQLRYVAGLSQIELAAKLGISAVEVYAYELAQRRPSMKFLSMWAAHCGHTWEMRFNPIKKEESGG